MRSLWRHVEFNYQEGGLRQIVFKVFWRSQQWLWSESVWLIYKLEVARFQKSPTLPLGWERLDFDQMVQHQYFKAQIFPEAIRARLSTGAVCHGFFLDRELANVGWTTWGRLELEGNLSLPEKECIGIFDCFTLPAHRSKGVYTDTLLLLAGAARDQGASTALIAVDPVNHLSIKGIERAGFQPLYQFKRLRRFGRDAFHKSGFELKTAGDQTVRVEPK